MSGKKTIKENAISNSEVRSFRKDILRYFNKSGRDLPWRRTRDPYKILVSELMLQQTQVDRVINKYGEFVEAFPDFSSLGRASLTELYSVWQGLGYNRRLLALKKIARAVVTEHKGRLPDTVEQLSSLPGIGPATAASICAFAFNQPTVFIETNIRTVFIHRFFRRRRKVDDSEIAVLIEKTLDKKDPRTWYSALMDYGAMLKKTIANPSGKNTHYTKQSPFKGSRRQVRGKLLRTLLQNPGLNKTLLIRKLGGKENELFEILEELIREGMIKREKGTYSIA